MDRFSGQKGRDRIGELRSRVRLCQDLKGATPFGEVPCARMSGHQQHRKVRPALRHDVGQFRTGEAGHLYITENNVNGVFAALQDLERRRTVAGLHYPISQSLERMRGSAPDDIVVIDKQDERIAFLSHAC